MIKVLYAVTSGGGDSYDAMTRVSVATARLTNPAARIEIACDQQTYQALRAADSPLFAEADAVHGFPTPAGPATFRNRFVKTQLRLLLDGPFLFLDGDTVVRGSLAPLLQLEADAAAAPNHSANTLCEQIWSEDQANLDAMGWRVRAPYCNGGVIWYADTVGARHFARTWHDYWITDVQRTGRHRDQPALNYTLATISGIQFAHLTHHWNAQYAKNPASAQGATIWHAYSSIGPRRLERFSVACRQVRSDRVLSPQSRLVRGLVHAHSPYVSPLFSPEALSMDIRRVLRRMKREVFSR